MCVCVILTNYHPPENKMQNLHFNNEAEKKIVQEKKTLIWSMISHRFTVNNLHLYLWWYVAEKIIKILFYFFYFQIRCKKLIWVDYYWRIFINGLWKYCGGLSVISFVALIGHTHTFRTLACKKINCLENVHERR